MRAAARMYQSQRLRHRAGIGDDRELNLRSKIFLNPLHPFDMGEDLIHTQPNQFRSQLLKLSVALLESIELRCTNRGEVRRMAEENKPLAFELLRKIHHPVSSLYFHLRKLIANQGYTSHNLPPNLTISIYTQTSYQIPGRTPMRAGFRR